jgi:cellulose synthase/poly-beta-1,6-N-acetylglucosamine synthase-like glycosyltransferase
MLSIIITAKDEAGTVGRAVEAFLKQLKDDFEIIVVAPDRQTLKAARNTYTKVKTIQDRNRGKAMAMNLAINEARGERLIFSDGDVVADKMALAELLKIDGDLVSGRPVVLQESRIKNQELNKYEFWQECLVDMAHRLRSERSQRGEFLPLSGYLFAAVKKIFKDFKFPENCLTEDEYLSFWAWQKGYKIKYAALAKVRVKFADNYRDWKKQKVRTLGGSYQIPKGWKKKTEMRSLGKEGMRAWQMWKNYVKSRRQALWMILLFLARLEVWFWAFLKVKLLGQSREKIWQRVQSTK